MRIGHSFRCGRSDCLLGDLHERLACSRSPSFRGCAARQIEIALIALSSRSPSIRQSMVRFNCDPSWQGNRTIGSWSLLRTMPPFNLPRRVVADRVVCLTQQTSSSWLDHGCEDANASPVVSRHWLQWMVGFLLIGLAVQSPFPAGGHLWIIGWIVSWLHRSVSIRCRS